jgi:hypothetical protein
MLLKIHPKFESHQVAIAENIEHFDTSGILFVDGQRNKIKLFELGATTINVKSFKVPNFINRIVYRFFRKSKARRSFEFANLLLEKGILTPQPIAFAEDIETFGFGRSFYICEHLKVDLTFRELVEIDNYPDYHNILNQFMQFCFLLHEKGIEFLDHSPGNTLIKKVGEGKYDFFLVDLNRMNFHSEMDFESRMKNLAHLTPRMDMVAQMSAEYAKLYTVEKEERIFEQMWFYTNDFQRKFHRKISLKKKLRFWK